MPTREQIATFSDPEPPPGQTPWVEGRTPRRGIEVVAYDPDWPAQFAMLADRVRGALGARVLVLEHVGSTAVPGLAAKPIIDIDLVLADPSDEATYLPALEAVGFELRVREPWWHQHRCLAAYDPACNLHVAGPEGPEVWRHRILRDWLRTHPDDRERYAAAKREAAAASNAAGEHTMEYNARKQAVVREIYGRAFVAVGVRD